MQPRSIGERIRAGGAGAHGGGFHFAARAEALQALLGRLHAEFLADAASALPARSQV